MKSMRYDSVQQRQNKQMQVQLSQPLQLQYSSQPRYPSGVFYVAEAGKNIEDLVLSYVEMLNQETDVYYLFDSFHQILNSVKQAQLGLKSGKVSQGSRQNTLDWWKLTGSSQSWSGVRNLQPLSESHLKDSSRFLDSYQSKQSAIIDGLKRQIGELTEEQKFKQNCRTIGGVAVQVFNENELQMELRKPGRTLLTLYQLQNKYHKCHMGFALVQPIPSEEKEIIVQKMYIAKWYRKNGNFYNLVSELMKHLTDQMGGTKIKIKVNSSQGGLIRHLQSIGFKLSSQLGLINDLKIITLLLLKKDNKS